jgi:hypothetical protein
MAKMAKGIFALIAEVQILRKQAVRELLKQRRTLDRQLARLGHSLETAGRRARRGGARRCAICGKTGHNSRTCPLKDKKG